MGLPVRGQRTRTQVSFWLGFCEMWDWVGFMDDLLTRITTDYDGEEVQPHRQDEIGPDGRFSFFVFISHALHVARLSRLGARDAYTTVKDTNVQKNNFKRMERPVVGRCCLFYA